MTELSVQYDEMIHTFAKGLTSDDLVRILRDPKFNLIQQQVHLMKAEGAVAIYIYIYIYYILPTYSTFTFPHVCFPHSCGSFFQESSSNSQRMLFRKLHIFLQKSI